MDRQVLERLNSLRRERRAAIVLTNVENGDAMVIVEGDPVDEALAESVERALRSGKSGMVETDTGRFFLNVYLPPTRIVVIGAVHISQAMAPIARIAGFDIEIIDPRTAFASSERFAGYDLFDDWPETVLKERPLDPWCAVAAITHDPKIDDYALVEALRADCFYVGALGSRKTHAKRNERLLQAGLTEAQIASIAAPIGLDIGAASPAEIAIAIMAQIIEALRKRELTRSVPASMHAK